jgi:membrane protein
VVLFGASLAASLTTFSDYSRYETEWPERWEFQLTFRLLGHLFNAQRDGKALTREQFLELEPQASELQIVRLLSRLRKHNVISLDDQGDCLLSRDLEDVTLGNLYEYGDYFLPLGDIAQLPVESDWDRSYIACLKEVYEQSHSSWERPLRHMYMRPRAEDS